MAPAKRVLLLCIVAAIVCHACAYDEYKDGACVACGGGSGGTAGRKGEGWRGLNTGGPARTRSCARLPAPAGAAVLTITAAAATPPCTSCLGVWSPPAPPPSTHPHFHAD
jgi:hypothetical protein